MPLKITIDAYLTSDRMPEPYQTVVVAGGSAYWTGSRWITTESYNEPYRREILWPVLWWMPIPTCADISEIAAQPDGATT